MGEVEIQAGRIPRHVAIILDGNGRWAKKRGLPRTMGHSMGAKRVEEICEAAYDMGVEYLTVYAFSTENWSRPPEEVAALMKLLRSYLQNCIKTAKKNRMRVRILGDKRGLDSDIRSSIEELEEATKDQDGLRFQIALNYGGRDELLRGMRALAGEVQARALSPDAIGLEDVERHLDTAGLPDPDLLIRTCGEQRISNFLLWQLAYTELYFAPVPWPDFDRLQLALALEAYAGRERRYGKVSE